MLSYDYPILGVFFTMMWFFIWIIWLIILFRVIVDLFRSDDLSGWGKALWLIFVVIFPYLGVFVYLIARGKGMGQRDSERAQTQEAAFRSYVQDAAATGGASGTASELAQLADLRDKGVIDDADFEKGKAKLLG